jgi:phage shock protein A
MQARAGAVDELLASGALNDLSGSSDPLQAELDKTSRSNQVELELAQLKGELPAGDAPAAAALEAGAETGQGEEEPAEGETVPAPGVAEPSKDLFSLDGGSGS